MTYTGTHVKYTFSGYLKATDEVFSTSLKVNDFNNGYIIGPTLVEDLLDPAFVEDIGDLFSTFWATESSLIPSDFIFTTTKAAVIAADGKYDTGYADPVTEVNAWNTPGGLTWAYAPQLSTVFTFDSGKFKDPGKYGRMYIPTVGLAQNLNSVRPIADTTPMSVNFQTLINGINSLTTTINGDLKVVVMSNKGTGITRAVESIKVGNVIDTQRRRRNQLIESYVVQSIS